MGKQADKKLKQRRAAQKRSNAHRRALATADNHVRNVSEKAAEYMATAPAADVKALEAELFEFLEAAGSPERLMAAVEMARKVFAAALTKDCRAASPSLPGDFPAIENKARTAITALRNGVPAACPHLWPEAPLGMACVDESDTIMCPDCLDDHMHNGHTAEWDRTCSECGGVDMRGISVINTLPVMGVPARFGDEVRVFVPPVMLTGLGLCNPCRLAAGKKRARMGGGSGV